MTRARLQRVFHPRSIAVVGMSDTSTYANSFTRTLSSDADLYFVHPKQKAVFGRPAYPSLRDVGVPVADGRGLSWKQGPDSAEAPWTHWCNGAAGVGAFFLSLWSATGDATFHDAAVSAGRAITSTRPFGSCCRCHGLAGDGDFLLDLSAAGVCGAEFRHAAEHIGAKLDALAIHDSFAVKWPHEGNGEPRPGYMRGYTGVHSFRLRLAGLIDDGPLSLPEGREHDDH